MSPCKSNAMTINANRPLARVNSLIERLLQHHRSVLKLISRIASPPELIAKQNGSERRLLASKLHNNTFGLTSDPLTLFSCAFSALIHDVDHPGIPNSVLMKENIELAKFYKFKSIAEQNSVDLSLDLLMEGNFADLRSAIFSTKAERDHFRQIVVNCVIATDIMDRDLKVAQNQRWRLAFNDHPRQVALTRENDNRKATLVIEHLMQASDIAHTMQHVSPAHQLRDLMTSTPKTNSLIVFQYPVAHLPEMERTPIQGNALRLPSGAR